MDYLQLITPDLAQEILYRLDPYVVKKLCKLNKYFQNKVCTSNFWNLHEKKNKKIVTIRGWRGSKYYSESFHYNIIGTDYHSKIALVDMNGEIKILNLATIVNNTTDITIKDVTKYIFRHPISTAILSLITLMN